MSGVGRVTVSLRRSTTRRRRAHDRDPEHLGDEEGQLQALLVVQPRVADRLVPRGEGGVVDLLGAAQALGDVVAGELDVQAARHRAQRAVHLEEAADLVDDVVEPAGLVAAGRLERVAVHGIADPGDLGPAGRRPSARAAAGPPGSSPAPIRVMKVSRPGTRSGSSLSISASASSGRRLRAELDPDRVVHPRGEVDVGTVQLAGALARSTRSAPTRRTAARSASRSGSGPARSRAAAPRGRSRSRRRVRASKSAPQAAMKRIARSIWRGQRLVARVGRVGDEAAVPLVHVPQVGEPALGERPDEVQRRRRRVVRLDQPARVGRARLGGEGEVVDRVPAVRRQGHAVADLVVAAARLGELARPSGRS